MKTLFNTLLISAFAMTLYVATTSCSRQIGELKSRYWAEAKGKTLGFIVNEVMY